MDYVNARFFEEMRSVPENREMLQKMQSQVDAFMQSFSDSPERISRWGHYYFCEEDGGRLIFDLSSPHAHRCEVCGKVFQSEILDGVWTYFYRNRAVVMGLVSAAVYRACRQQKYLDYAKQILEFYADTYAQYPLHNKENGVYDSLETMAWGCGKMMPQGLNESIVAIRFAQTVEMLKPDLEPAFLDKIYRKLYREMFHLLAPQVRNVHNISVWNLSAIGVMGLQMQDPEMIDFAFHSRYNISVQLREGVTADYFWYEGSIHYNFFLLEGASYLLLFSHLYGWDFGEQNRSILENMLLNAYALAFDNDYFPNPNDGWPNLNLKTFGYIYHTVGRVFGQESPIGNLVKNIEANPCTRTILPLSEPYYLDNRYCLERLLFNIDWDYSRFTPVPRSSYNYPRSNYAMLRSGKWNAFVKYGLNGRSHAHPDIMNVELTYDGKPVSRDLSNAGYRSRLCNEWHRRTLAHNTVVCNGTDIPSCAPGETDFFDPQHIRVHNSGVYEGVDYFRSLAITDTGFSDVFQVRSEQRGVFDYVFHFERGVKIELPEGLLPGALDYRENGYEHILECWQLPAQGSVVLRASLEGAPMTITLPLEDGMALFLLKTMDNPVNSYRTSILIRGTGQELTYRMHIGFPANKAKSF